MAPPLPHIHTTTAHAPALAVAGLVAAHAPAAAAAPPPPRRNRDRNGRFARANDEQSNPPGPARSPIKLTITRTASAEPKVKAERRITVPTTVAEGGERSDAFATAATEAATATPLLLLRGIARRGEGVFEDWGETGKEERGEGGIYTAAEAEIEAETDSTDELQKDYSTGFDSKGKTKDKKRKLADYYKGKENQTKGEEGEGLTLLLHPKPKRFGLTDPENNRPKSRGSLGKVAGGKPSESRVLREQVGSPPYTRPSRFQKRGRKSVEEIAEGSSSHSTRQVAEVERKKHTTTQRLKLNFRGRGRGNGKNEDTKNTTARQEALQSALSEEEELPPLPENTVCISQFLKPQFFAVHMPSLEVIKKRRTSSGTSAATAVLVNGVRKSDKMKLGPHRSPVSHRKSLPLKDKDGEERNIDNIIFGDITFKAWYPSWYPKEIIGEKEGKDKEVVSELYVCKKCFGYGKDVVEWRKHVRLCQGGLGKEGLATEVYRYGGWEGDGRWSVWEVDGSVETVRISSSSRVLLISFNYFLLVHTSPPSDPSLPPERQIIGFFSKEKMSWDNNNLACILIFPPWQRKGLGAILIGVSYAIAKREGIMGGPEKPISELGMKGYKRYWGAEISRWILEYEIKPKSKDREDIDVDSISRDTWIAPDDCLAILREMGVVEKIEEKGGKALRKEGEGSVNGGAEKEKEKLPRVRLDKLKVREWVEAQKLRLEVVVSEDGFLEGYALPEEEEEEDEEEEVEEEEEETEEVE